MASFTMPETFRIAIKATCPTRSRTEIVARQHRLLIDEPPARHGTDRGPTPLETLLSAYLACTNVIANMIAEEMGVHIDRMNMALTGHLDTRGVFNKADVEVPFPRIELAVEIVTNASQQQIAELKTALARRCPVSVILRQAGSQIIESWTIKQPRTAGGC